MSGGRLMTVIGLAALGAAGLTAAPEVAVEIEARLAVLDPGEPLAYLELAEEVADAAEDEESLDLARHLFALAGLLDPPRLGRSSCLALADIEPKVPARRRLLALAALLDERAGVMSWPGVDRSGRIDPSAALAVAEALSRYRRGQGGRALNALGRPGAMELLEEYGHVLRGGARRFVEDCRIYRGPRKPMLSADDLTRMLRLERALLAGPDRSWADELMLTRGRPLIEVDPDRLQETFGVDPSRPYYRDGRWVSKADG